MASAGLRDYYGCIHATTRKALKTRRLQKQTSSMHAIPSRRSNGLVLTLGYKRGISAVSRDRRRRFRGTRRRKLQLVKDLHQLKKMSQGPVRRLAGMNSPATRSSAGFVMREIQTGLHKPEGGTKQPLTKSADNSAPVCFPNCVLICLGSRVSFDLPLAQADPVRRVRQGRQVHRGILVHDRHPSHDPSEPRRRLSRARGIHRGGNLSLSPERDQRSTTESTEIHGKENPNQLSLSVSFRSTNVRPLCAARRLSRQVITTESPARPSRNATA